MNEERSRRDSIAHALGGEPGDHPTYEMLEELVDGTADDVTREIIVSHREVCPQCDAEVRDLMSFTERSPAFSPLRWIAAAAAMIAVITAGVVLIRFRLAGRAGMPVVHESVTRSVAANGYGREDWNAAVRIALERGAIDPPAILGDLRPAGDVLRTPERESNPAAIMDPAGVAIDSTTPMLTWRAPPGHSVASVYDGFQRVARSDVLQSPQWRVSPPLARGRTYTWQVEIRRGASVELLPSAPAPAAFVHVLDESNSAALAEARRRFPDDHLLLGVLHARAGVQQAAVEELRMYAAQHPELRNAARLADSVARW